MCPVHLPELCSLLRRPLAPGLSPYTSRHRSRSISSQVTLDSATREIAEPASLPDQLTASRSRPKVSGSSPGGPGGRSPVGTTEGPASEGGKEHPSLPAPRLESPGPSPAAGGAAFNAIFSTFPLQGLP